MLLRSRFLQSVAVTPLVYATLASIGNIISLWSNVDRIRDSVFDSKSRGLEKYDFIVVGAGSAGAIVANRLSRYYTVLLLEAGGEPNPIQMIPGMFKFFINYPQTDWMHKTVPQRKGSLNSANAQSSWSCGKGLGGTGNMNGMIHLRGHPSDYDNWAKVLGDPNWSYEGVLPYFKISEDYRGPSTDSETRGIGGPLHIESPDYIGMSPEWIHAGEELGYPHVDLNGRFKEGFDTIQYPIKKGIRQAPFEAYIKPARRRRTLTIKKFSQVNKILIRHDNSAYGVVFDRHQRTYVAHADKEVIISAGAMGSAKLLMLSGIGPVGHLHELGIPVRANLPVGKNLQDHLSAYLGPFFINQPRTLFTDRDINLEAMTEWLHGRGILTSSGLQATAMLSSPLAKAKGEGNWPDIQLALVGISAHRTFPKNAAHFFGLEPKIIEKYYAHAINQESFHIPVSAGRPLARGEILLGGNHPDDHILIDPKYLEDPYDYDLRVTLEGIKIALNLVENTTAFQRLGARFTTQSLPRCEHLFFRSEAYWECFVRQYTVTLHHPCGTAALGTVVDTELRVIGMKGLRVIDASVIPIIPVSNTQAPTMMIAEKGADMVLRYWMNGGHRFH